MSMVKFLNINYEIIDQELFSGKLISKRILKDISFEINEGEIVGLVGESGSGKTTIAKIAAGLVIPTSGEIVINRSGDQKKHSDVQILFQNNDELLNPFRKVRSVLKEAFRIGNSNIKEINSKIFNHLELVKLEEDILNRYCSELSGGERIRVALIRVLAAEPKILILDEPFAAQDEFSQTNFVDIFNRLKIEKNLTMLIISHNTAVLKGLAQRIIILRRGEIVEEGSTDEIFINPKMDYTKFLTSAENYNLSKEDFDMWRVDL